MLRIGLPLLLIAGVAYWILNHTSSDAGQLRVTTSVTGAEILIGGMQTGFVSDTTLTTATGRRIVTVRKPNYVSVPEFAVVEVTTQSVNQIYFVLRPAAEFAARDTIAPLRQVKAEVFNSGEPVHRVPRVSRDHYGSLIDYTQPELASEPPRQSFVAESPSHIADNSPVTPSTLPVVADAVGLINTQITVSSNPEGSRIFVNGQASENTTPYTFKGLDRGVYAFSVEQDGYVAEPAELTVTLTEDFQRELAAFELKIDPSLPTPTLTISTTPLAAGFKVNGKNSGTGKAEVPTVFGSHKIEFADVPGYRTPSPVTVTLTPDQPRAEASGTYERITGNSFIAVLPNDDVERFDGSMLRVFVDNELIVDSPKQRFDATLIGKQLSGKRLVRIQYGDLSTETFVELLDGEVCEISFRIESFFSKRRLRLRDKSSVPMQEWQQKVQGLNVLTLT